MKNQREKCLGEKTCNDKWEQSSYHNSSIYSSLQLLILMEIIYSEKYAEKKIVEWDFTCKYIYKACQ